MLPPDRQADMVALISSSQTRLLAYIFSLTANRELSEEILQSTNLVIWRKADTYESGTNFIAWAFKIARLQILEHRKKHHRDGFIYSEELVDELAIAADASTTFQSLPEQQIALRKCIKDLPPSRRELLWLRYRDSKKLSEIAEMIGKNTSSTGVLLHRLRQLLMDCVKRKLAGSN